MSATTLQRLLKHPHAAVFDKSPEPELAFRLSHANRARWSVSAGVMTAVGAGTHSYDLTALNVGQLALALQADGFTVSSLADAFLLRSALVLVEAEGDEALSNGDQVQAFTSLLWVILSGYAREVDAASEQVRQALRQMVMTQAEGEWLDLWGALYNTPRRASETDAHYAGRIPEEAFRLRNNAHGIELAILDETGYDVRIAEPWKEIFFLDESLLSGPCRLYDGDTTAYHLIRPEARQSVVWPPVHAVIERNRAAGVLVIKSRVTFVTEFDLSPTIDSVLVRHRRARLSQGGVWLDFMAVEDVAILNHPIRYQRVLPIISQAVANQANYAVHAGQNRTYRVYMSDLTYGRNWAGTASWRALNDSWRADAVVGSRQSRS